MPALLAPAQGWAQAAPPADSPIVVIGTPLRDPPGTPAYGSVRIDRDRLTATASGRIEDALRDVAGFQQFRRSDSRSANPSAQGATLRALGGNASSRTLVLLDGVPMADPFFGYIPFSAIVPERLAFARVTRGGGVGAFGAGAVAGTIELGSATRADLPDLSASAFYGSDDATELSATLTQDLGGGMVTLSGRWDRGDGFNTTPADQRTAATVPARYDGWSVGLRAVAPISPNVEMQARALLFRDNRTLRFAGADSGSEGQDASVRILARGRWQVDALAYIQARNFDNVVISATTFRPSLDQRNTPSTGIGGKFELRPPVGDAHVLRIGLDTRLAQGDMYEDSFNAATGAVTGHRRAHGRQSTSGLFVEDDWTLGALVLTGGARIDRWTITNGRFVTQNASGSTSTVTRFPDRDAWEGSFRAGALFHVSDGISLRAAGYTGYRLPTLNELYRPFSLVAANSNGGRTTVATDANAALAPEKLKGAEVGMDLSPLPDVHFAATAFYNRLDNAVGNVTLSSVTSGANVTITRQRQNIDAIIAKGIELTASARRGDWSLSAAYAYSHSRVKAPGMPFDGLVPAQSPRHTASATLSWLPETRPGLSGTIRYTGRQYEDDLQTDVLRDALTVDALAQWPLGRHIMLVARAENIFDATIDTRNAGGSRDLGSPRTLWIGARLRY
nr:TonB-dependent receptor [Sphingobium subterraneum]